MHTYTCDGWIFFLNILVQIYDKNSDYRVSYRTNNLRRKSLEKNKYTATVQLLDSLRRGKNNYYRFNVSTKVYAAINFCRKKYQTTTRFLFVLSSVSYDCRRSIQKRLFNFSQNVVTPFQEVTKRVGWMEKKVTTWQHHWIIAFFSE